MKLDHWPHAAALIITLGAVFSATESVARADEPTPAADSPPAVAAAPAQPIASLALGAGAMMMPSHPGSARMRVLPLPYVDARVGPVYASALKGVGLQLGEGPLYIGASVYLDFGRQESSDPVRLAGRGDIGMAADPRIYGGYRMPLGTIALARVEVSGHRHLGGSDAVLADLTAGVSVMPSQRWTFDASVSSMWMSARYARTFFDADASGIRDVTLGVFASYGLNEHWSVGALGRAGFLVGDASSSPVVATRFQPTTMAFVSYRF